MTRTAVATAPHAAVLTSRDVPRSEIEAEPRPAFERVLVGVFVAVPLVGREGHAIIRNSFALDPGSRSAFSRVGAGIIFRRRWPTTCFNAEMDPPL